MMVSEPVEKEIKMAHKLQRIAATLLVVTVFPVWAGHSNDRYPEPAYVSSQYEYAKVVDVQPIVEIVQIPQDRQVCRQQPVQRRVAEYRSPAPSIFGAIVGGVIGNQLSRGHGNGHGRHHGHGNGSNRAAATLAGAAIGSAVATGVQHNKYPPRYYTQNVQVCSTQTSWHDEERVVAWDVSWKYRGRVYHSRMDEPPGDRIRVRVSVDPVYP
jgi:uncharacterized protein YcfJ